MLTLLLLSVSALPVQLEEVSDVAIGLEHALIVDLERVLVARIGGEISIRDCRTAPCADRDAGADTERIHVLMFGGPTRVSITAERLGRGRALRASVFVPNEDLTPRLLLDELVRGLFPDVAEVPPEGTGEILAVARVDTESLGSGPRTLTVVSLVVAGVALVGAVTFGVLAQSARSEFSSKQVYDDDVPVLSSSIERNGGIAVGCLGVGLGAGVVALITELTR